LLSDSGTIRIGCQGIHTATYIVGISGVTVAGDRCYRLQWPACRRDGIFKALQSRCGDASEAILALKPVTFRYKGDLDPSRLYNESISDIAKMPAIS